MVRCRLLVLVAVVLVADNPSRGDPKPAKPENLPKVAVAIPMAVVVGTTTKIVLRGKKLDTATEVRCPSSAVKVKLLKKGTAGDIARVGNTQAEIEVSLPADFADSTIALTVVSATGVSNSHRILVDSSPVVAEKEPNNGFAVAQPITIGQTVAGAIDRGFDVDVYRFEGKSGQHITAEVFAARHGSPLDSFLTLYTGDGQTIIANDDLDDTTTDSRLDATLPRDGSYFLVLVDANDHGGPAHVYRLGLRARP
jgi:hypothetical protein